MKKKSILVTSICVFLCIAQPVFASGETSDYVGVNVGNKLDYIAKMEYKINSSTNLVTKLNFSIEVVELGLEQNHPQDGNYTPVVFRIFGSWTGDNLTNTPVNETLRKITGNDYNTTFDWNVTDDIYDNIENKFMPSSPKLLWIIATITGSRTVTIDSTNDIGKSSWNTKGVLVVYKRTLIEEDSDTGYYERKVISIEVKDNSVLVTTVSLLSILGISVALVLFVLYKKGKIPPRKKLP
ncbi:MAG: hypothetical protein ACTSU9_04050 [Promethearchaeota archaeon]